MRPGLTICNWNRHLPDVYVPARAGLIGLSGAPAERVVHAAASDGAVPAGPGNTARSVRAAGAAEWGEVPVPDQSACGAAVILGSGIAGRRQPGRMLLFRFAATRKRVPGWARQRRLAGAASAAASSFSESLARQCSH